MLLNYEQTFYNFKLQTKILNIFSFCFLTRFVSVIFPIITNMVFPERFFYLIDSSTFRFFKKKFAVFRVFWANWERTRGIFTINTKESTPRIPPTTPAYSRVKSTILRGNGKKVKRQINYLQRASICGVILYGKLLFGRRTTVHSSGPIVSGDVISI